MTSLSIVPYMAAALTALPSIRRAHLIASPYPSIRCLHLAPRTTKRRYETAVEERIYHPNDEPGEEREEP